MLTRSTMDDEATYRDHADELTAFATSIVGPDLAADAVSAAVVSAFSSSGWGRVENRRAYLYRAVYNQALRIVQRDRMRSDRERLAGSHGDETRSDVELANLRPDVADAVRELSTQQRAVIVLTYWQDMAITDVADHLGISDGAVRKHLARARTNLRSVLDA